MVNTEVSLIDLLILFSISAFGFWTNMKLGKMDRRQKEREEREYAIQKYKELLNTSDRVKKELDLLKELELPMDRINKFFELWNELYFSALSFKSVIINTFSLKPDEKSEIVEFTDVLQTDTLMGRDIEEWTKLDEDFMTKLNKIGEMRSKFQKIITEYKIRD